MATKGKARAPLAEEEEEEEEEPTILTPKAVSSIALVSTIFAITYLWFRRGIYDIWSSLAFDPSAFVAYALPNPGHSLSNEDQAHFAFIASVSHTAALVAGMLLFGVTTALYDRIKASGFLRRPSSWLSWQAFTTVALIYGFYTAAFAWFTATFNSRQGVTYRWARAFFYEEGESPFASCAGISYSLCLICGYLIKLSTNGSRFSAWPRCWRRYAWRGLVTFVASYLMFRYVAIAVFKRYTQHILSDGKPLGPDAEGNRFNPNFIALATGTHTAALVGGMLACYLTLRGYKMYNTLACTVAVPHALRWSITSVVFSVWVSLIVFGVVKGALACANWAQVHWEEVPAHLLSATHLVWFAWGCLILYGRSPSLVSAFSFLMLLPAKLSPDSRSLVRRVWRTMVVVILYNLEKVVVAALTISLVLAPFFPNIITAAWIVILLRYTPTFRGNPALTGCRHLPAFQNHWIFDEFAEYFNFDILSNVKELNPNHRFIFGFHPHGVLPISIGFVANNRRWKARFPNIVPAPVTSSIIHHVPLMRDFLQFCAGGDVSRRGIATTIERQRSLVMVPGGQQEMIFTSSRSRTITICARHRGFVRLAYRLAAASEEPLHLVPCVNFGANKIFDNVPAPIAWQKASVKHLRANVFFGPYGEFGLLGVPRSSVHMRLAVAEAIEVPRCRNPSEKDVALLHGHYMKALKDVFERFKAEAPGYQDADLRFDAHLDLVGAEAWAAHRAQMQEEHDPAGLNALFRAKPDSLEAIWTSIFWVVIFSAIFLRALFSEHHIWQSL